MNDNQTGKTVGNYILLREERKTRVVTEYWGRSVDLSREVTCYVLLPNLSQDEAISNKFQSLAQTAASLYHPGLIRVLEHGKLPDPAEEGYLISEWIPGANMAELLAQMKDEGNWVTMGEAVRLVRQLALIFDEVRNAGAVRVVNTALIKFRASPIEQLPYTPVVVDLGLETLLMDESAANSRGAPPYLSPEGALNQPTDPRSDVYSLGVLLYELTTGQLPFPVVTQTDAARYHPRQPLPPPRSLRPDMPQSLEAVIIRALQKVPGSRFETLANFAEELSWLLPGLDGVVDPPPVFEKSISLAALYLASLGDHRLYAEKIAPALLASDKPYKDPATRPVSPNPDPIGENGKIEVTVDQVQLSVEPGRTASTVVVVHNSADVEAEFNISIEGVAPEWVALSPRKFTLKVGEQKTAQLIFKPPRLSRTRAGRYPITVRVRSTEKVLLQGEASITLTIGVYNQFRLEFPSPRTQGDESTEILITNTGNVLDTYTISPVDIDGELGFEPEQSQVRLNPEQVGKAEFKPYLSSLRLFGGVRSHAYTVSVKAASGEKQNQTGEHVSTSLLPAWVPLILLLVCMCFTAAGLFYLTRNTFQGTSAQRTSMALRTSTFDAAQSTLQAATLTVQALENANQATIMAVTQTAQAVTEQAATQQVNATITSIAETATAIAAESTSQADATSAVFFTQTAVARETEQSGLGSTATAVALTATAQTGQLMTATAQVGNSQTATAQAGMFLTATAQTAFSKTATAQAGLIQTATAQAGFSGTATAQAATATAQANLTKTPVLKKIAYFYLTSTGLGKDYQEFLQPHGYQVELKPLDSIPSTDLNQYRVILIAPETGQDGNWGDANGTWANKIVNSNLPVIGLGEGGFNLFGKTNMPIGYPNGIGSSSKDIFVLNPNDLLWKTPNPIPIPGNKVIQVYNNDVDTIMSNLQPPFPANILAYVQWPENVNQFSIIRQDGRMVLWGFRETPKELTPSGASLLLNFLAELTK